MWTNKRDSASSVWLTPAETAAALGVGQKTLGRMADRGELRTRHTPGGHRRYLVADVEAILRASDVSLNESAGSVGSNSGDVVVEDQAGNGRDRSDHGQGDERAAQPFEEASDGGPQGRAERPDVLYVVDVEDGGIAVPASSGGALDEQPAVRQPAAIGDVVADPHSGGVGALEGLERGATFGVASYLSAADQRVAPRNLSDGRSGAAEPSHDLRVATPSDMGFAGLWLA